MSTIYEGNYKNYNYFIKKYGNELIEEWLCGYVRIPPNHPLYNVEDEFGSELSELGVHGGITYARDHIIGFDCHHARDDIKHCNKEYVINELHELIDQLVALEDFK